MDSAETPEDKKARLIAEARKIKAPIDLKWDVTEIEAAVAKKKAQLAAASEPTKKAEPVKTEEAAEEGGEDAFDDEVDGVDYAALAQALKADLSAERAAHDATKQALETVKSNLRETADMLRLRTEDLDAANMEVTEFRLKFGMLDAGPNVDAQGNPVAPPPAAAVERRASASSGPVKVRITKQGHGKVDKGDGTMFGWNDEPVFPRDVAEGLESRGFAEIQE